MKDKGRPCTQWVSAERANLRNSSEAGAHNLLKGTTKGRGLKSSSQSAELKDFRTVIYSLNKLYTVM